MLSNISFLFFSFIIFTLAFSESSQFSDHGQHTDMVIVGLNLIRFFIFTGGFYAPNGSVIDWWSQETTNNFLTARQCVIDYYSSLEAGPYKTKTSVREGEKVRTICRYT